MSARENARPGPPPRVGRYRVLARLAAGGMAEILLGAQDGTNGFTRPVVVKRVLPHLSRKGELRKMFVDEARLLATLRHPNVVAVEELGEDGDAPFLVMEYLEGESLDAVLRAEVARGTRFPAELAAHVVAEVCAGLHAAHEHRDLSGQALEIVHRDVSPSNVFVGYDGRVKVIDFGIAKAANRETRTETGMVKGKFAYMSPEQIEGSNVDRRTDVFALGVVLHELLTSKRLFQRSNQLEIVRAICLARIPRPTEVASDVPSALDAIAMKALEREREGRFETALAMRRALHEAASETAPDRAQDALAERMNDLFADRRSQKTELTRRIRSGEPVHVTAAVRDEDEGDAFEVALSMSISAAATVPDARNAWRGWMPMAAGIAAIGMIALGIALASTHAPEPAAPPIAAAPPSLPAPPSPEPAAPAPTPEVASMVRLRIESQPSATVELAGEERGTTPLALEVPRSDQAMELVLHAPGYRVTRDEIVASSDQSRSFVLRRERRAARRTAPDDDDPFAPVR